MARVAPAGWAEVDGWDEVVEGSARPSAFLDRDWLLAWWAHFGGGSEPWVLTVRDGDGLRGVVPLRVSRHGPGGTFRRLGQVGDLVVGSEYLGAAAVPGAEAEVVQAALDEAARLGLRWDVAHLVGLPDGDPAASALADAVQGTGRTVEAARHPCAAVPLPADADEWEAGLGGSFRRRTRQRRRRLGRDHAVGFRTSDLDTLERDLEVLFALHRARWVRRGRPGAFADPRMRAFYRDVGERLATRGRLRFWHLEVDGVVRASQFGFVHGGTLHSLQEAYDSEWAPEGISGLGVVLRDHVIRSCIDEGLCRYDFLGGDEAFKQRWGTVPHHVHELRVAAPGPRGALAAAAVGGRGRLRASLVEATPDRVRTGLRTARARYRRRVEAHVRRG